MQGKIWFIISFFSIIGLQAQTDILYEDHVYMDHIKSVKFHHAGLVTSIPIIDLNEPGQLILSFDDMEGGDKEYIYKLTHCDRNWQPSDIDEFQYLDGFSNEDIQDASYSRNTIHDYTHYRLSLPNDELTWTVSGNYVVAIYDNEYNEELVITRRFMVVENEVTIGAGFTRPRKVRKARTHHEIDLDINYKDFNISNPMNEIEVTILQNGRWDTAITGIKPRNIFGRNMRFQYIDKLNFPAGREFRFADLRSIKFAQRGINSIDIYSDGVDVLLDLQDERQWKNFHTEEDINGNYIIQAIDERNDNVSAEYVNAIISLETRNPIINGEVYVFGAFSDWKLKEECLMTYDALRKIYYTDLFLKQGFYNYLFVVDNGNSIDDIALEGSWHETENDYQILVYYAEMGSQFDRLIGVTTLNSGTF